MKRQGLCLVAALAASVLTASVASASQNVNVSLVTGHKGSPFYVSMGCGASAEAKKLGVSLTNNGPTTWDPTLQIPIVNAEVADHPNAMVIVPNDPHALAAPLQQAKNAGIKIITADTGLAPKSKIPSGAVTSQSFQGGVLAAHELVKLMGSKGTVLLLSTDPGITTSAARAHGFLQTIKKYPNIKVLPEQFTQDANGKGESITAATLAANSDLTGIFATDQDGADGAATALKAAGMQNKVTLVGFDAEPSQVQELKEGLVKALVEQEPYQEGRIAVQMAVDAAEHKKFTKSVFTPLLLVTKATLTNKAVQLNLYKTTCS
jgi:ribose transport system substrate-binding protein